MRNKQTTLEAFKKELRDGMTIMFGGFMGTGTPATLVAAILESGVKDLTIIGNDTSFPGTGVGPLIVQKRVRKVIGSHFGLNPETGKQMNAGTLEVEAVPQGTLIERIRAGGSGLGGVLTPTGVGTVVEEGKQRLTINGKDYLLEMPLRADLAILGGHTGDKAGNVRYRLSTRNFNPIIALAADKVYAEVEHLVEIGGIDPDLVMTPAALVTGIIVKGGK